MPGPGFGIPFSAFDEHMTANNLWPEFDAILAERAAGTLDNVALQKRLFHLRMAIYQAPMNVATRDAIYASLEAQFGNALPIRLRSSTNVEDLAGFSGAGLYTSAGVTLSDPEAFERGLKVVWSSTFNYAAFVEREFYRVDQREIRMGILVHPAFENEVANGVAITQNQFTDLRPAYYINAQAGEVSVTNPSGQATPEQILYYTWYTTPEYEVLSRSSLTGDMPVMSDDHYLELATFLQRLRNHFNPLWCQIPNTNMVDPNCSLDVEWKLATDGMIYVKQARPLRGVQ
jgi:phosphoenolpyruvate synthase/pyruvate phosphate dikinase